MNIIITGASEGLGFEIAKKFVSEGHNVAICARNGNKLIEAFKELQKRNNEIMDCTADVSKKSDVEWFIKNCIEEYKKIDVLINNAGIYGPKGKIEDTGSKDWEQCIKTNLLGPYYTMKYIIPHMKQNKYGKIINIAGGGATKPLPFISAYAASKAGLVRLTESIAEEVKDYNIDVNCVSPGLLETKMYHEAINAGPEIVGKKFFDEIVKKEKTPLSVGAELCYWLASKESDGITGRLISAPWDDYMNPVFKTILRQNKDLYTLRRVNEEF